MESQNVTLSARVPGELAQQIDLLSEQYHRSRSWLLQEALKRYVADELQFLAAVQEGRDAVARGEVVTHEEVVAALKRARRPA